MKTTACLILTILLACAGSAFAADRLSEALQKGLFEEEANRNLDAAIRAYQSVIQHFDEDRKLAATAVFRVGECYRKQGNTNGATGQYQRILREFSDQSALADLSRKNLESMGAIEIAGLVASPIQSPSPPPLTPAQAKLLQEEIKLVERQIAESKQRFSVGAIDGGEVARQQLELLSLQRKLPENRQPARQKDLIEQQIQLIQGLLSGVQKKMENGQASSADKIPLQRELLGLQRELLAVSQLPPAATEVAAAAPTTSAEAEEVQRIKAMIKDSPDLINAKDNEGKTPLHKAAEKGQLVVAQFLLSNHADVNAKGVLGKTPLHLAAISGHKTMVELLLEKGADVNARDDDEMTPLLYVAQKGFLSVAEVLLAHQADVNAKNKDNPDSSHWRRTALHFAASSGNQSMVELLLAHKADVNAKSRSGLTPLLCAAQIGSSVVAQLLINAGAKVNATTDAGETPLFSAVQFNRLQVAELLLTNKAEVNLESSYHKTPLSFAIEKGNLPIAKLLLDHGANPDMKATYEIPRANQIKSRLTPLLCTARTGNAEMAELLLKYKANINAPDDSDRTPLWWAVEGNRLNMAKLLLANGADANLANDKGYNPLFSAADTLNKAMVELLLEHGAKVNVMDKEGKTPLSYAKSRLERNFPPEIKKALNEIIDLLLQHGANENLTRMAQISVSRKSRNLSGVFFTKDKNGYNHYTLFELIAHACSGTPTQPGFSYPFPDFSKVTINRLGPGGEGSKEIPIDLEAIFKSGDCSKDMGLEWGDIVEIPETDHKLNESWPGLPKENWDLPRKCQERKVEISVKGQVTKVVLKGRGPYPGPGWVPPPGIGAQPIAARSLPAIGAQAGPALQPGSSSQVTLFSFGLKDVVYGVNVLLASSDVTRVKVKRIDPATKQTLEMVFNLEKTEPNNDLWLRDGDVIEVPEKE